MGPAPMTRVFVGRLEPRPGTDSVMAAAPDPGAACALRVEKGSSDRVGGGRASGSVVVRGFLVAPEAA